MEKNVNNPDEEEDVIKIILVGESGVGKTNLINAFFGFGFNDNSDSTLNSYCFDGQHKYNNKEYKFTIWDTAGQEKYRSINKMFFRDAKIILVIYSIDNRYTFEQIDFWMNHLKENIIDDKYIIALIANKCDLIEDIVVMEDDGREVAKKYDIEFSETSAKTNAVSFKNFVLHLIEVYVDKYKDGNVNKNKNGNNIKINKNDKPKKKKCC